MTLVLLVVGLDGGWIRWLGLGAAPSPAANTTFGLSAALVDTAARAAAGRCAGVGTGGLDRVLVVAEASDTSTFSFSWSEDC